MINKALKKINEKISPGKMFFPPEWIILGVNNVCNLHCKMCDVGTQNLETNFAQNLVGSHPLNMPMELFEKIVDEMADYCPDAKLGYAFTEPLVYPKLKESLLYAKSKDISTYVTTNALNLKRKADDLIEADVKELFISLDGLEETHNYIRGNKKSFQKAIEGIEYLMSQERHPEISVYCVITEWNFSELEAFIDFFSKYNLKHVGFMHQNFITDKVASIHNALIGQKYEATHSNIEEVDMSKIDLEILFSQIESIKSKEHPFTTSFSPDLKNKEETEAYYNEPEKKLGKTCNDVFTNMMIKTDGSVIPAHGRCYNVTMGNINDNSISEVWNASKYQGFRKDIVKAGGLFPACNRCCSAF